MNQTSQKKDFGSSNQQRQCGYCTPGQKLAGNDSGLAGLKADEVGGVNAGLGKLDEPQRFTWTRPRVHRFARDNASGKVELPIER